MGLVVFDLDDTLTDNRRVDYASYVYLHDRYGLPLLGRRTFVRLRLRHWRSRTIISRLARKVGMQKRVDELLRERLNFYDSSASLYELKQGAKTALKRLSVAGYTVAIATGIRRRITAIRLLESLEINPYVDQSCVYCIEDIAKIQRKESAFKETLYLKILKELGKDFPSFHIVGNRASDLASAKKLGFLPIGVPGSYYIQPGLDRIAPIANDFSSVVTLIGVPSRKNGLTQK